MHRTSHLVVSFLFLLSTSVAYAGPDAGCEKDHAHGQWQEKRAARVEKHKAQLHDALKLSAAQETAWASYQSQLKPQAHPSVDIKSLQTLNTLQRLDQLEALEKTRSAQRAQRTQATRAFYSQLNAPQQQIFDALAMPHHGHPQPF